MLLPFPKSAKVVTAYRGRNLLLCLQSGAVGCRAPPHPGLSSSSLIFPFLPPVTLGAEQLKSFSFPQLWVTLLSVSS